MHSHNISTKNVEWGTNSNEKHDYTTFQARTLTCAKMSCFLRYTKKERRVLFLIMVIFILLSSLFTAVFLPYMYPYGYIHYIYGVPVERPKCQRNSEKYYLTLSTIVRNRAEYMAEWIEFHLMQGIEHLYMYDNNSTDNLKKALQPYIEANLVTIKQWPHQTIMLYDGYEEILTQKLFLKDVIESHACETRWMAMLDSDEFVLPGANSTKRLREILKLYESYSALVMPWLFFTSNGWIRAPHDKLIIEAYTRRWVLPQHKWKQIIQPKRTRAVYSAHNFLQISGYNAVNENKLPFGNWPGMMNAFLTRYFYNTEKFYPYDVIRLHHYKLRSAEDWERRKMTGKSTGINPGIGKRAMMEHWKEYFKLEGVESQTDYTMLRYVRRLKERLRKRFLRKHQNSLKHGIIKL